MIVSLLIFGGGECCVAVSGPMCPCLARFLDSPHSWDNTSPSMDDRIFHGCTQVFVGALYLSHGVIDPRMIFGKIHAWGVLGRDEKRNSVTIISDI